MSKKNAALVALEPSVCAEPLVSGKFALFEEERHYVLSIWTPEEGDQVHRVPKAVVKLAGGKIPGLNLFKGAARGGVE